MNWLTDLLKNHAGKAIGIPTALSAITFFGNLALALSDGVIDDAEFHNLLTSASGVEMLVLVVLMLVLKKKKD